MTPITNAPHISERLIKVVLYSDLDEFLCKEFQISHDMFSCVGDDGMANGSYILTDVVPIEMNQKEKDRLAKGDYDLDEMLNQMCFLGKLPQGEYLIEVYW